MNLNRLKILLTVVLITFGFSANCFDKEPSAMKKLYCKIKYRSLSERDLTEQFLIAVVNDDINRVSDLLLCGADVNSIYIVPDLSNEELNRLGIGLDWRVYKNRSALMLAQSFPMVEFLIKKGANVNYEAPIPNDRAYHHFMNMANVRLHDKNVFDVLMFTSVLKSKPEMAIWILKAGGQPTKEAIDRLERLSVDGSLSENERRTARAILRYIELTNQIKLARNKAQRQRIIQEVSGLPRDLIGLMGDYIVGEDEEKRNQEPELVVHFPEGV